MVTSTLAMPGIPPALDSDTEDVAWALQTAEALWRRNERTDALVWLRRAAQAAGDAEHDDRAVELASDAAELAEWIADPAGRAAPVLRSHPDLPVAPPASGAALPTAAAAPGDVGDGQSFDEGALTQPDEVEDVTLEIETDTDADVVHVASPALDEDDALSAAPPVVVTPVPPPAASFDRVPSAAEKHAGILDPWAAESGDAPTGVAARGSAPSDADEVLTSAPPVGHASSTQPLAAAAPAVDLSGVEALADLPDDARDAFARAADVRDIEHGEELSGFALALIVDGSVYLAATIVDTPAERLDAGEVMRARGTIDHVVPVRLVSATPTARVAVWDDAAVDAAFHTCPWVEDDLRAAGDRLQAVVGLTMGPLGERLDPELRAQVAGRLTVRVLAAHEVFAARGKPVPGLLIVGAGELELVDGEGRRTSVLRSGEFLFANEVLTAAPAPATARAGKGGALVLFAERRAAQELLVTCPPLLEVFAGA